MIGVIRMICRQESTVTVLFYDYAPSGRIRNRLVNCPQLMVSAIATSKAVFRTPEGLNIFVFEIPKFSTFRADVASALA